MNKQFIASLCLLAIVGVAVGVGVKAGDNVTATVTPQIVAVSVSTENIDYGVLNISETSDPSVVIIATNEGNVTEKFEIYGSDSTSADWTLSDTAVGEDIFMHEFATDDDSYASYTALDSSAYATLDESVSTSSGTQLFKLQLKMPSSTSTTDTQSTIVTIVATAV